MQHLQGLVLGNIYKANEFCSNFDFALERTYKGDFQIKLL